MTVPAAPVTDTDVHEVVGVHVAHVSIQYMVHEIPTHHASAGLSVTVTSTPVVVEFALSVVIGAVIS